MALVELDGVCVSYPKLTPSARSFQVAVYQRLGGNLHMHDRAVEVQALSDVSLRLTDGDRLGMIGSNGAGKTTLLRVIAGVLPPQRGRLQVEGHLASYTDFTLGMDSEASGWDNIIFRCIFMGLTFEKARALAPSIAEFSGLGPYLDLPVRTYSSGMFIRLAFSVTTAIAPDVLVMDEMIGAADAQFLDKAQQRLSSVMDSAAIMVLSSHNVSLLQSLCNRAIWMDGGRIRAEGGTEEVLKAYHEDILARAEEDKRRQA
jgi:ABC-type polysaccharide/polyol phosphate transport system ATPase subunit